MANRQLGNRIGVAQIGPTANNRDVNTNGGTTFELGYDDDTMDTVSAMRAALLAVNGGVSYTAARLNTMTENDMVYALRCVNNPTGARGY
jgi:hypothetical protein